MELDRFLEDWVAQGEVSAVVGRVARREETLWSGCAGEARAGSRFDLASLTKPFTGTLAATLHQEKRLSLGVRVGEVWSAAHPGLACHTLEDLLRHRAGLRPWLPLYALCGHRGEVADLLVAGEHLGASPGTYSDLGLVLWGLAAEEVLGEELSRLLRRHLLEPLELSAVGYAPGSGADVCPCRCDNGKEVALARELGIEIPPTGPPGRGEAQDGNARFLKGHAAHAGLFATVEDLHRLALAWLRPGPLVAGETVEHALRGRGPYALVWARRRVRGAAGPALGRSAFGHVGFTGGSLWIDPPRGWILILLAHRTSPFSGLDPRRRRFHRLAADLARRRQGNLVSDRDNMEI